MWEQLEVAADDSNGLLGFRASGNKCRELQVTGKDLLGFSGSADGTAAGAEVSGWDRLAPLRELRWGLLWVVRMRRVAASVGGGW